MLSAFQQFFTGRPTIEIARDLLGKLVTYDGPDGRTGGYIVECEAYLGENDSASHAYNGRRTGYSESLYGQPEIFTCTKFGGITALTSLSKMPRSPREFSCGALSRQLIRT